MEPTQIFESLRLGLEASIMAQFGFLATYLLLSATRRRDTAALVAGLSLVLATTMLLNAASALGLPSDLRLMTVPLETSIAPLVYLIVRQLSGALFPTGKLVALLAAVPLASAAILLVKVDAGIAPYSLSVTAAFIVAAWRSYRKNSRRYRSAAVAVFVRLMLVWLSVFWLLRGVVELEAWAGSSYRGGAGYILVLGALLLLSFRILYLCLNVPGLLLGDQPKYDSSYLADDDVDELERRLVRLLETEKIYHDPDLNLSTAAAHAGATEREISQVINSRFGSNFAGLINRKRVEEAASRLAAEPDTSVTRIMFEVGFGSKSAFQREFGRRFGLSPTVFRRRCWGSSNRT